MTAEALPEAQQDVQKTPRSWRRRALLAGGCAAALVAAAAVACTVLCLTALSCSAAPFSMVPKSRQQQQHSGGSGGSSDRSCPVTYATLSAKNGSDSVNVTPPLLLGGVSGACKAGCQPRTGKWADSCAMDPHSTTTWGLCDTTQRPMLVELAGRVSNGAMLEFSPCDLYNRLRGRTLWLIGDSHMKSTYAAVRCLMFDFWDQGLGECGALGEPAAQLELHNAEVFTPRNLKLKDLTEPRCIHLVGDDGGRICFLHTVRGEVLLSGNPQKPGVLDLLQSRSLARPQDVLYISLGRWYTHSCSQLEEAHYNSSLHALAENYEATRDRWPHVLFGVPPFDHTTCAAGWDAAREASCPVAGNGSSLEMYDKIRDYAHDILDSSGLTVIDYQEMTRPLHTAHLARDRTFKSGIDCLHYCRPGLPEMDLWFVYRAMQRNSVPDVDAGSSIARELAEAKRRCLPVEPYF